RARRQLESDLRKALARGQFELFYQPLVNLASGAVTGAEALIRWHHPERGLVSPDKFVRHAEETGLIVPIGEWVVRTACAAAVAWPSEVKVSVNLSAIQFKIGNIVDAVIYALSESGLAPERLHLEITESVLLEHNADNLSKLHQLRQLGIGIVLDDFGKGFSSLSYVQQFPFDKIKIDRSFVRELPSSASSAAIICAVNGLARGLNMITLAEGVETQQECELLRLAGCEEAQGFMFGKPVPASALDFASRQHLTNASRAA